MTNDKLLDATPFYQGPSCRALSYKATRSSDRLHVYVDYLSMNMPTCHICMLEHL